MLFVCCSSSRRHAGSLPRSRCSAASAIGCSPSAPLASSLSSARGGGLAAELGERHRRRAHDLRLLVAEGSLQRRQRHVVLRARAEPERRRRERTFRCRLARRAGRRQPLHERRIAERLVPGGPARLGERILGVRAGDQQRLEVRRGRLQQQPEQHRGVHVGAGVRASAATEFERQRGGVGVAVFGQLLQRRGGDQRVLVARQQLPLVVDRGVGVPTAQATQRRQSIAAAGALQRGEQRIASAVDRSATEAIAQRVHAGAAGLLVGEGLGQHHHAGFALLGQRRSDRLAQPHRGRRRQFLLQRCDRGRPRLFAERPQHRLAVGGALAAL